MKTLNAVVLFFSMLTAGCPPRPKPTPRPSTDMAQRPVLGIPPCPDTVHARTEDVCDGLFVAHQIPCGNCRGGIACVAEGAVYCSVDIGCASDPLCKPEPGF